MSCKIPPEVLEYIELVESGEYRCCPEQIALVAYVRRVFDTEDIFVDTERLAKYMGLQKYFPFKLFPWQKFIITLWLCTYSAPGVARWPDVLGMLARGAGKDGFIAFVSFCMLSPYNPVPRYNVDICANNEDQAIQPVTDLVDVLETPALEKKLNKHFYHTKELVQGRKNRGKMKGHTNSPKGRDGLRSSMVIFNEVHQYQNYANITVFTTGMGKTGEARKGYFTSNGEVSDGPLDDYLAQGRSILFEGVPDDGFLPFICCLDSVEQVHDEANWYMANPSLQYLPELLRETRKEYKEWCNHPERAPNFVPKRMGLRAGAGSELAVTDYEKVKATNKPLPDLRGWSCIVGLDYAELSDWAAVNLHFKRGNERFDINHAWICKQSKTLHRVKAPWQAWAEKGHVTVVDDVSINPKLLALYVREQMSLYNVRLLAMDNFRWTLVSEAFREIGFDAKDKSRVKLIRPSDIMRVEPVIQECFDRGYFHWGDVPHLRWAVNNTKRVRASKKAGVDTGNFIYAKIEGKSRKTDPFMALVASMVGEDVLGSGQPLSAPPMGAIAL